MADYCWSKKSLKSETKKKLYRFKFMKIIYEQYFIYETCWTLNLLENQSHKSKQVVFQIWGWYLKKWTFSNILFGPGTKFSPIRCQQNSAGAQWLDVWFAVEFLSLNFYKNTRTHTIFFMTHTNHTLTSIPTHPHNYSCIIFQLAL